MRVEERITPKVKGPSFGLPYLKKKESGEGHACGHHADIGAVQACPVVHMVAVNPWLLLDEFYRAATDVVIRSDWV